MGFLVACTETEARVKRRFDCQAWLTSEPSPRPASGLVRWDFRGLPGQHTTLGWGLPICVSDFAASQFDSPSLQPKESLEETDTEFSAWSISGIQEGAAVVGLTSPESQGQSGDHGCAADCGLCSHEKVVGGMKVKI